MLCCSITRWSLVRLIQSTIHENSTATQITIRVKDISAGHVATPAPTGSARAVSGESQASGHRKAATDSLSGADSLGAGGGLDPDPASFPQQAATVGLQRTGFGDPHQRGIPFC